MKFRGIFYLSTLFVLACLISLFSCVKKVNAVGVPPLMNFQGKVVNKTAGTNITNGSYSFTFSLYTQSSGGVNIWTETKSVTVTNGIFQINLGDTTTLPGSVDFNNENLYLGINFNGDGEMSPRIRLTSVPYALNAQKVAGLSVTNTTGTLTIPNGETISFGGSFSTSGSNDVSFTTSGTTTLTLPTAGTLATLDGIETLINKTIGSSGLSLQNGENISNGTDGTITLGRNDAGVVTITAKDNDSTAGLTIISGGASTLALDTGGSASITIGSSNASSVSLGNASSTTSLTFDKGSSGNFVFRSNGSALDCSSFTNGGALTLNSSGQLQCSNDDGGAGGSSAWDQIGDPTTSAGIAFAEYAQTMDWNTGSTAQGFDGLTFNITNDASTDSTTQRLVLIQNADDGGSTGTTESLLTINNADTNEAVTNGLLITSTGNGGITNAINIGDTDIITDISLQNGGTIDNNIDGQITFGSSTNRTDTVVYGDLVKKGLTQLNSLTNINDIFVYDTTRDSDAGLWTEPSITQQLSWYNETKESPCTLTTSARCGSSTFPKKAILIATNDSVYILDANTNTLWMRFTQTGAYALGADTNNNPSSIFALNGVVYVGTNGTSATGLYAIDFVRDRMYNYDSVDRTLGNKNIANRNSAVTYADEAITRMAIGNNTSNLVNDVHVVVMYGGSNIETNGGPGNGKTYIAAATDDGISVINVSELFTLDFGSTLTDQFTSVFLTKRGRLYGLNATKGQVERFGSQSNNTTSPDTAKANVTTTTDVWDEVATNLPNLSKVTPTFATNSPDALEVIERASFADELADVLYIGSNQGMTEIHDVNTPSTTSIGWSKFYTTTGQTGYMSGTSRGMFSFEETTGDLTDKTVRASILEPEVAPTYGVDGVRGKALSFNGTSQFLCSDANNDATCDTDADFNVAAISSHVELWFKHPTTITGTDVLVDRRYTALAGTEGVGYTIEMGSSGQITYGIQDTAATAAYDDSVTSTQTYNDNLWHHLVAVNTDTAICLYIDGKLAVACDTTLAATATLDASQILFIGADGSGAAGGNFWDGQIDEVYFAGGGATTSDTLTIAQIRKKFLDGRNALSRRTIYVTDATEVSSTTIGDTGESWLLNEFVGSNVEITEGPGLGQTRKIIANTSNTLTVYPAWTTTPETTSDFEIAPEQLYGSTNIVRSIGVTDTDFLGSNRRVFVGTSDGSGNGGVTVLSSMGSSIVQNIYHSDAAKTDDSSQNWNITNADNIQAIDAKSNVVVIANQGGFWTETASQNFQQSFDKLANNINSIRSELAVDGITGTSSEVGTVGGADLAEYYYSDTPLEPGSLVSLDPEKSTYIVSATHQTQHNLLGVIATSPAIILGEKTDHSYPVALVGRVPVNITSENGFIKAGDRITTSSVQGYGKKTNTLSTVIGYALEDSKEENMAPCSNNSLILCGQVLAFIQVGPFHGTAIETVLNSPGLTLSNNSSGIFTPKQKEILNLLSQMKKQHSQVQQEILADQISSSVIHADTIYTKVLKAERIEGLEIFTSKISSLEERVLSATSSSDTQETSIEKPDQETTKQSVIQELLAKTNFTSEGLSKFSGDSFFEGLTYFFKKVVFRNQVEYEQPPLFSNSTGGFAVINKGETKVNILFEMPYQVKPIVTITPMSFEQNKTIQYYVSDVSETGFTLNIDRPLDQDIQFSWITIAVKDPKVHQDLKVVPTPEILPSPSSSASSTEAQLPPIVLEETKETISTDSAQTTDL